jgi:hypothetical protein
MGIRLSQFIALAIIFNDEQNQDKRNCMRLYKAF